MIRKFLSLYSVGKNFLVRLQSIGVNAFYFSLHLYEIFGDLTIHKNDDNNNKIIIFRKEYRLDYMSPCG